MDPASLLKEATDEATLLAGDRGGPGLAEREGEVGRGGKAGWSTGSQSAGYFAGMRTAMRVLNAEMTRLIGSRVMLNVIVFELLRPCSSECLVTICF